MNAKLLFASAALASPFLITGTCFVFMALRIRAWPSVAGKILESKLDGLDFKARYSYAVHAQAFEGSRITMADWAYANGVIALNKFQKRFTLGREVPVYYDPANPKRAVLEGPGFGLAIFLILWGTATFVGWLKFGPEYQPG